MFCENSCKHCGGVHHYKEIHHELTEEETKQISSRNEMIMYGYNIRN